MLAQHKLGMKAQRIGQLRTTGPDKVCASRSCPAGDGTTPRSYTRTAVFCMFFLKRRRNKQMRTVVEAADGKKAALETVTVAACACVESRDTERSNGLVGKAAIDDAGYTPAALPEVPRMQIPQRVASEHGVPVLGHV